MSDSIFFTDPHKEVKLENGDLCDEGVKELVEIFNEIHPDVFVNNSCEGYPRARSNEPGWYWGYIGFHIKSLNGIKAVAKIIQDWNGEVNEYFEPNRGQLSIIYYSEPYDDLGYALWWSDGRTSIARLVAHLKTKIGTK